MGWVVQDTETGENWGGIKFGSEEAARKQAKFLNEREDDNGA